MRIDAAGRIPPEHVTAAFGGQARPAGQPTPRCQLDDADGTFKGVSWSPDGRQLVFEAGDGIHVMDVPGLGDCAALRERLVVPGGTDPDWGPAEAPAVRGTTGPRVTATVAPAKLRSALRRGLRVSVTSSEAGRVVIVGAFKRKVVAAGTRKLRAPGKYTVTVKFAKKAKRGLVHAKTVRLALAIGVQDADANIAHTKRTVTLR